MLQGSRRLSPASQLADHEEFFAKNGSYFLSMYGPTAPFMMVQTLEMIDGFIRPGADVMSAWQVEARWVMKPGCREQVKQALKLMLRADAGA